MKTNKILFAAFAAVSVASLHAAVPEVSAVTMSQDANRLVTITYTLADAPAVITLDVQTNATGDVWASIGGEAVCNASGDVWKKVGADLTEGNSGSYTISWHPDLSWPDHKVAAGGARAVVTAWALDNTPDYMVVDISNAAQPDTQTYYPGAEFVPGGVSNGLYKTTTFLMRKIMAKDVKWTMGSTTLEPGRQSAREATHQVTLTNNYYIGVYQTTQAQWALIQTANPTPSKFSNAEDCAMRPVENVSYNEMRTSADKNANSAYYWPADPNPDSFLGKLRTKTGIDFDLPSEAQWEFAARAGNGDTKWGNGSGIVNGYEDANLKKLGRYKYTGGWVNNTTSPADTCRATNGTAIVGSYAPNSWGIYDMSGNVWELCLDWYEDNINARNGAVNINPSAPSKTLSGENGSTRVSRGGSFGSDAGSCRAAYRAGDNPTYQGRDDGFRVACTAGLK